MRLTLLTFLFCLMLSSGLLAKEQIVMDGNTLTIVGNNFTEEEREEMKKIREEQKRETVMFYEKKKEAHQKKLQRLRGETPLGKPRVIQPSLSEAYASNPNLSSLKGSEQLESTLQLLGADQGSLDMEELKKIAEERGYDLP